MRSIYRALLFITTILAIASGFGNNLLHADIESATLLTAAPLQYERIDFVVMLTAKWQDPYRSTDVRLDLELSAPSGKPVRVPGFYESGVSGASSVWRTRYAPGEMGRYTGHFVLTQGQDRFVSGPVTFTVGASTKRDFSISIIPGPSVLIMGSHSVASAKTFAGSLGPTTIPVFSKRFTKNRASIMNICWERWPRTEEISPASGCVHGICPSNGST